MTGLTTTAISAVAIGNVRLPVFGRIAQIASIPRGRGDMPRRAAGPGQRLSFVMWITVPGKEFR
jgi:hypothetical protein